MDKESKNATNKNSGAGEQSLMNENKEINKLLIPMDVDIRYRIINMHFN